MSGTAPNVFAAIDAQAASAGNIFAHLDAEEAGERAPAQNPFALIDAQAEAAAKAQASEPASERYPILYGKAGPSTPFDPQAPSTLPTGGGRPYAEGVEVNPVPGGENETFIPSGRVRVPGQTLLGAANAQAGQSLVQGTADLAAGIPRAAEGMAHAVRSAAEASGPAAIAQRDLAVIGQIDAGQHTADDPLGYAEANAAGRAKIRARLSVIAGAQPPSQPGVIETRLGDAANAIEKEGDRYAGTFHVDPRWANNPAVQAAGIVGGSAPMVVGAVLGGLPGAAGAAFSQTYSSTFRTARAHEADPGTAHAAALANGLVNAGLMAAPAAAWLGKLPLAIRNKALNFAADLAVNAGVMIGFGQAQQLADNVVARETWDPQRPITTGLGQNIGPQALAGAVLGAPGAVGHLRGAHPAPSPAGAPEGGAQTAPVRAPPAAPNEAARAATTPVTPAMPPDVAQFDLDRMGGIGHPGYDAFGNKLTGGEPAQAPAPAAVPAPPTPAAAAAVEPPRVEPSAREEEPPPAPPTSGGAPSGGGAGPFVMLRPDEVQADPDRFQYKQAGARGVTGALLGTDRWEPALANPITAWEDVDGNRFVVNGHQRLDLARRAEAAGQQDVQIPAQIYREADGWTPEAVRDLGAYQNIAEGTGTAMDAARVLRAPGVLPQGVRLPELPPRGNLVRQARGLAALSPETWGLVENGVVEPSYAASVGELLSDPAEQAAAMEMLARRPPANANQARLMVEDIRNAGFLHGNQTNLFGDEAFTKSLVPERAQVLDAAMRLLRGAKRTFSAAISGEDALTGAGNVMASERNVAAKTQNERLLDAIQRDATNRGPISDALTREARELAAGRPLPAAASRFLASAQDIERRAAPESLQRSDTERGEEHPGGPSEGSGEGEPGAEAGRIEDEGQAGLGFGLRRGAGGNGPLAAALKRALATGDVKRGAEAISNRLRLQANLDQAWNLAHPDRARTPPLTAEGAREVEDFIGFIGRHMFKDVGLRVRAEGPSGVLGSYSALDRIVTIYRRAIAHEELPRAAVHELWHSLERVLPRDDRLSMTREFRRQREKWLRKNAWARPFVRGDEIEPTLRGDAAKRWLARFGSDPAMRKRVEIRDLHGKRPTVAIEWTHENYRFADPSEYWAETMSDRYFDDREIQDDKARSIFAHLRDVFRRMVAGLQRLFGRDASGRIYEGFRRGEYQHPAPGAEAPRLAWNDDDDLAFARRGRTEAPGQDDMFGRPAAAGASAPKPRIEQTEMFPGMPGDAVQAQAARDQAGRGALLPKGAQKAADEGLFAAKVPEQPTLASGADVLFARRGPGSAHQPIRRAVREVLARGARDGGEHAVLIDGRTGAQASDVTSGSGGSFPNIESERAHDPASRLVLVHNHPEGTAASVPDVLLLVNPGLHAVVSAMPDGSISAVQRGPSFSRTGFESTVKEAIRRLYEAALHLHERGVRTEDLEEGGNEALLDLLHSWGQIDHVTSRTMGTKEARVVDLLRHEMGIGAHGNAVRPGSAVRLGTDDAMGRLSETAGEPPAGEPGGAGGDDDSAPRGPLVPHEERVLRDHLQEAARATQRGLGLPARAPASLGARLVDDVHKLFAPTARAGAKPMEHVIRAHQAARARSADQTMHALDAYAREISKLPEAEQLEITHRAEAGLPQPTEALTKAMGALRAEQAIWTGKIRSLGPDLLKQPIEGYMGRIYSNYAEWKAGHEEAREQPLHGAIGSIMSKGPIRGSGAFLKQRTFPTLKEAMEAGLKPVTTNPIRMQALKLLEMQKFYHGTRMSGAIKASGLARWVPYHLEGDAARSGLVKLNDPAFQPVLHDDRYGVRVVGNWYAPEPVARVFNNYVSKGFAGNLIYDTVRSTNNALNMLQLEFSGFHAFFLSLDSMISRAALGLRQASVGELGRGLGNIAMGFSPTPVISTARKGAALRRAWIDPATATPLMRQIANLAVLGGARSGMPSVYRTSGEGTLFRGLADLKNPGGVFKEAWQAAAGTPVFGALKLAGRLIDTLSEPLMGQLVPRVKMGVFANMAENWLLRHPDATIEQAMPEMTKLWDSVDNRMGQVVYDNLFWNKKGKDIAFILGRSVGWNLGTVREIAGAGVDAVEQVRRIARGEAPELTPRMAYTIMMALISAAVGTAICYAVTGKGPVQMFEHFFPPDGKGGYLSIPGYMKDVIEFWHAPLQTVLNKTSPLIETAEEMAKNRDYYGGSIYDPLHDQVTGFWPADKGIAYAEYLLNQVLPFSLRGAIRERTQGATLLDQALSFWGIQPAPKSITDPALEERWQRRQAAEAYRRRMREPGRIGFGQ